MAIRVDRGDFDPTAVGMGGSSGVSIYEDGLNNPPWVQRPWKGSEDYGLSEAMRQMAIPAEQLAAIRPPVPYTLMPPDSGYDRTPVTIEEVLDIDRWAPQQRSWISPTVRPVRRADPGDQVWSGSARNTNGMSA